MTPKLIIIFGDIGSGKTTLAKFLAKRLDYELIYFDDYVSKVMPGKIIYGPDDEFLLDYKDLQHVYDVMKEDAKKLLLEGRSVILESMYYKKQREEVIAMTQKIDIKFSIVNVVCTKEAVLDRVRKRKEANAQTGGEKLFLKYYGTIEPEEREHITIDTTNKSPEECATDILKYLV